MRLEQTTTMLTEQQCAIIEKGLNENVEPRKVAAYLCMHMGLMLGEVTALQWKDIDLDARTVTLRNSVGAALSPVPFDPPRVLPMPPHVARYIARHAGLYANEESFILTGESTLTALYHMQNALTSISVKNKLGCSLSASDLRNTFIRRCIQSGMDLYSICAYIGIKQPNVIVKRFGEYFEPKLGEVGILERFAADYSAPVEEAAFVGPRKMNLLILGAGSQGPVVKEIAEAIGVFNEIAFLDDDPQNKLAIGTLADTEKLVGRFPMAIASFGNCELRRKHIDALEELGYIVPTLIHPSATISPNATIERSVVVEARCIVSSGASIGRGTILSSAGVIETSAAVGEFAHIGSSVTVAKGATVGSGETVASGTVIRVKAEKTA